MHHKQCRWQQEIHVSSVTDASQPVQVTTGNTRVFSDRWITNSAGDNRKCTCLQWQMHHNQYRWQQEMHARKVRSSAFQSCRTRSSMTKARSWDKRQKTQFWKVGKADCNLSMKTPQSDNTLVLRGNNLHSSVIVRKKNPGLNWSLRCVDSDGRKGGQGSPSDPSLRQSEHAQVHNSPK